MTPTPAITALLRQARLAALERFAGQPANASTLPKLAEFLKTTLLRQVALGMWDSVLPPRDENIADPIQHSRFDLLDVSITLGNPMVNEPALKIEFDFAKTVLPSLVVKAVRE